MTERAWYEIKDLTNELSHQALALLEYLKGEWSVNIPEQFISCITSAWYNGREHGICITIKVGLANPLIITFGEHRNSDQIFVDCWEANISLLNPPIITDFPEKAYKARRLFQWGDIITASNYIRNRIDSYLLEKSKLVENKP